MHKGPLLGAGPFRWTIHAVRAPSPDRSLLLVLVPAEQALDALERVLGGRAIAAPKRVFGETLGAGGALGMAAALAWLDGVAPSCIVSGQPPARPEHVLVTSLGYYGNASAVVMRRANA